MRQQQAKQRGIAGGAALLEKRGLGYMQELAAKARLATLARMAERRAVEEASERITLRLSSSLWQAVKAMATSRQVPARACVEEALRDWVEKLEKQRRQGP